MTTDAVEYGINKIVYWWMRLRAEDLTDREIAQRIWKALNDSAELLNAIQQEIDEQYPENKR